MEQERLQQFRRNLSDVVSPTSHSDVVLLKWLRARNFNLKKVEKMFRESDWFRAVFKLDDFAYKFDVPEAFEKYNSVSELGIAKDGTPVRYIAMGRTDLIGLVMSCSGYQIGRMCLMWMDADCRILREQTQKTGTEVHDVTYVFDMEGFSLRQTMYTRVIECGLDLIRLVQDLYPEIWKRILIINKRSPNLLLQFIDAEVLPAFLGGEKVGSNGSIFCEPCVKLGGDIPEAFYLQNREKQRLEPDDPGARGVVVGPRTFHEHTLSIRVPDSRILVEIRAEGGSLPFCVYYSPHQKGHRGAFPVRDEAETEARYLVCPVLTLQLHLSPLSDHCYAPWPGNYTFRFDNSSNWLTSRLLVYRLTVVPPSVTSKG